MSKHAQRTAVLAFAVLFTPLASAEIIEFWSGQSGSGSGNPGAPDDEVTVNPWGHPANAPILPTAFTLANFSATASGAPAVVVRPQGAWMGGAIAPLSDSRARWINYAADAFGGFGPAGSTLYAVPFWVNTANITNATLSFEGGVDDVLGDWFTNDGPNLDGLYVNGTPAGYQYQGFNFANRTTHSQNITALIHPGQNYLYFYQRDHGFGAGGIIFSGTVNVVPTPVTLAPFAAAGLGFVRRRRRAI